MLVGLSFKELLSSDEWYPYFFKLVNPLIMFARFICTSILHLSLIDELTVALELMKYSINHPYKFNDYKIAWLSGLLQVVSVMAIELASIGVICAATETIGIIFNFIALSIVGEFDNYVYASLKNESLKELLDKNFV